MRILVASHNYPRFPGDPAGGYVATLARLAGERGNDVLVIAPHVAHAPVAEASGPVRVRRFRYAPALLERIGYRGDARLRTLLSPLSLLLLPGYFLAFRAALRRSARDFVPDVIHAHWWFPSGWLGSALAVPLVVTCHGSDVRLLERSGSMRRLARGVFRRAAAVTAVSHFLATALARRLGPLRAPVRVLPMPVEVERFTAGSSVPKATPPRILFAGNLVFSKGVDVLIDAFASLKARGVRCQLRILGEGPALPALLARAAQHGLVQDIAWSRFVPQEAMPAEYGASTVAVLPTRGAAEGLGLSLVEALLSGCAVVGTPAGGIPEVIGDEETGLLARDGDAPHLADQLARLLTDAGLRARLVAEGQARVRARYAPATVISEYLQLYANVARDRAAP